MKKEGKKKQKKKKEKKKKNEKGGKRGASVVSRLSSCKQTKPPEYGPVWQTVATFERFS